jgi:hypothetical protein
MHMQDRLRRCERELKLYRVLGIRAVAWAAFSAQAPQIVTFDTVHCRALVVSEPGCDVRTTIGTDLAGNQGLMINDEKTRASRAGLMVGKEATLTVGSYGSEPYVRAVANGTRAMVGALTSDSNRSSLCGASKTEPPMVAVSDGEHVHALAADGLHAVKP